MKLVKIHWHDAQTGSRWIGRKQVGDLKLPLIETVGKLLRETEDMYIVSHTVDIEEEGDDVDWTMGYVIVPKGMTTKFEVLAE